MFAFGQLARKILPVVVVLWASLAMIGGGAHLAKEAEAAAQDTAVKAGIGLCAVSFAFFARKVRSPVLPKISVGTLMPWPTPSLRASVSREHLLPPPAGPPLSLLFRVSRT